MYVYVYICTKHRNVHLIKKENTNDLQNYIRVRCHNLFFCFLCLSTQTTVGTY